MIGFSATIKRFDQQGEKTGWTYISIPAAIAQKLWPSNKKAFRVKGTLDGHAFSMVSLLPMGDGNFIMALNAAVRRMIKKQKGDVLQVKMERDSGEITPPADFLECLRDEPAALAFFQTLTRGHQNYFINWITSAKTEPTRVRRIAMALNALSRRWGFSEMMRASRKDRIGG